MGVFRRRGSHFSKVRPQASKDARKFGRVPGNLVENRLARDGCCLLFVGASWLGVDGGISTSWVSHWYSETPDVEGRPQFWTRAWQFGGEPPGTRGMQYALV